MTYALDTDEPLDSTVRRTAREQLETAIERLEAGLSDDPVSAVHDARKALKKVRSLVRLTRGAMKPKQRRRESASLRAASRQLGSAREADALLGALGDIDDHFAGQIPEATILSVRQRLAHDRDQARAQLLADEIPSRVADELRDAVARVDDWRLRGQGWSLIGDGLKREYRRGRRAMKRAASSPTPERMHDWRKRTKDLWYHQRLLAPVAPGTLTGQAKDAHRLADLLGDLHDLTLLETAIRSIQADLPADTDALIALIEHRGLQLAGRCLHLGARVYAESAKAYTRRLRRYWRASRAQARAVALSRPELVAEMTRHTATA